MPNKLDQKYIESVLIKQNVKYLPFIYESVDQKIDIYCSNCNNLKKLLLNNFIYKENNFLLCKKCAGLYNNRFRIKGKEFILNLAEENNIQIKDFDYINNKHFIEISCLKCYEFRLVRIDGFIADPLKTCVNCAKNTSKIEAYCKKIFDLNKIDYIMYFKPKWLSNKTRLELDFYIPKFNLGIECQGIQHFKSVLYFGGEKRFFQLLKTDKLKKELCEKNNVRLEYINYNDNLEQRLNEILQLIKDYSNS